MDFSGYQNEIYLGGLAGQKPELPISYTDLEARAKEVLTPEAYGYVAGGAGSRTRCARTWRRSAGGGSSLACCATSRRETCPPRCSA